jgi:two-component sensor histidine kinase
LPEYYSTFATDISERKAAEEKVGTALAEKQALLMEIHHRVRNNLQVVISMLNIQARGMPDARMREAFMQVQNRIHSMALVHDGLYKSKNMASVDIGGYAERLGQHLLCALDVDPGRISIEMTAKELSLGIDTAVPLGLILNELLTNSIRHAFPDGRKGKISMTLDKTDEGMYWLTYSDDGVGLPRGIDIANAGTVGLQMVALLASQLSGALEIDRNGGTTIKLFFFSQPEYGAKGPKQGR